MLLGDMMHGPLQISSIMKHAARHHRRQEVVSATVAGPIHHAADHYVFVDLTFVPLLEQLADELPHGATGKVSKIELRRRFEGYRLPTA